MTTCGCSTETEIIADLLSKIQHKLNDADSLMPVDSSATTSIGNLIFAVEALAAIARWHALALRELLNGVEDGLNAAISIPAPTRNALRRARLAMDMPVEDEP